MFGVRDQSNSLHSLEIKVIRDRGDTLLRDKRDVKRSYRTYTYIVLAQK